MRVFPVLFSAFVVAIIVVPPVPVGPRMDAGPCNPEVQTCI